MTRPECESRMLVVAALLLALGVLGGSYLIAQGDYAPKVNVSDISTYPSVYVSSTPPEHAISVSATASEYVTPDLLEIQLRIETQDLNAKNSQTENAEVTAGVREELKALGIKDEEIQTSKYYIQTMRENEQVCDRYGCHWDYKVIGYKTVHVLRLRLTNLDIGGDVVDSATSVGTNQTFVDSIRFTLQDETRRELERSILGDASEKATAKAKEIASGLGVSLGKPLSASESVSYPYYNSYRYDLGAFEAAAAPSTEFSAGEVQISATVNVRYEIA